MNRHIATIALLAVLAGGLPGYWAGKKEAYEAYFRGGYDVCLLIVVKAIGWSSEESVSQCNSIEAMAYGWGFYEGPSAGWNREYVQRTGEQWK